MPSILIMLSIETSSSFVLNLVINGMPSILKNQNGDSSWGNVLNLVINGMPSILKVSSDLDIYILWSFKPCYKWNAFNTLVCDIENVEYKEF